MHLGLLVLGVIVAVGAVVCARRLARGGRAPEVAPELQRQGRILVIDDEPPIAQLLEDALTAGGYAVDVAVCGRDGVRLAETAAFDLVLSDLGMPDMTGWEVTSRIRTACPGTPVVLVTGWGTTLDEAEVERSGVTAVIEKPFEISDLLDLTDRLMRERAGFAPGEPPRSE